MQPSPRHRLVAAATSLFVVLASCLVLLGGPGSAAVGQVGPRGHATQSKAAQKKAAQKKRTAKRKAAAKRHAAKRRAARLRVRLARVHPRDPTTWIRYAPRHTDPASGP